jgi:hypothetical protein
MPWVGFEPTIPVFERAKTFHTLDRAAAVIGNPDLQYIINSLELLENYSNSFQIDRSLCVYQLSNPHSLKPSFRFGTIPHGNTDAVLRRNFPAMHSYMRPFNRSTVMQGVQAVKEG